MDQLAVLQAMLKLLSRWQFKITIDFITIVWKQSDNEDVKRRFLQHKTSLK